jgi:aerobic carbon-monoxide dehydrogenase large subunit
VRFVGEAAAMVVARSVAVARDAAELVEIDYDVLPAVTDTREAAHPGAPRLFEEAGSNVVVDGELGDAAGTAAAMVNAVVDALGDFGVRHVEMPATPERIWRAMRGMSARPHTLQMS